MAITGTFKLAPERLTSAPDHADTANLERAAENLLTAARELREADQELQDADAALTASRARYQNALSAADRAEASLKLAARISE